MAPARSRPDPRSRIAWYVLSAAMVTLPSSAASERAWLPPNGCIPDAQTAVQVAEAILKPIYGASEIDGEKPLHATERDGVWTVKGTFKGPGPGELIRAGGTAHIELLKKDARVVRITHGR